MNINGKSIENSAISIDNEIAYLFVVNDKYIKKYDEHVKGGQISHLFKSQGENFNSLYHNSLMSILNNEWYNTILEESWNKNHELNLPRCYLACGDNGKREVVKSDKTENESV